MILPMSWMIPAVKHSVRLRANFSDMKRAMETYRDNGFNGPFMMDHTPRFAHNHHDMVGKAFAIGYIRRLIEEVYG